MTASPSELDDYGDKPTQVMKNCILLKSLIVLTALAALCVAQGLHAQGSLIFNGGFDAGVSGWTLTNGTLPAWGGPDKGNPGGWAGLDSLSPEMAADPTISQFVTGLVQGQTYSVSGDYRKEIDRSGGMITGLSFGVAFDGVLLFEATAPTDFSWHHFNFSYTAVSPAARLSLSSQRNGTEVSYGIDNIVMWVVPEPSSFGLLGLGGCFFALHRFSARRSKRVRPTTCYASRL